MSSNFGRNNFQTHRIGLYYVAYELSKSEPNVEIDSTDSSYGHIRMQKNGREIKIMVKALSSVDPVPFSTDFNLIDRFEHLIICCGVYDRNITLYKLPIDYVKKEISSNVGKDGKTNYWLDPPKYKNYKVASLNFP